MLLQIHTSPQANIIRSIFHGRNLLLTLHLTAKTSPQVADLPLKLTPKVAIEELPLKLTPKVADLPLKLTAKVAELPLKLTAKVADFQKITLPPGMSVVVFAEQFKPVTLHTLSVYRVLVTWHLQPSYSHLPWTTW